MHWLSFHIISVTQDILFVMISWRHCLASSTSCTISILCICQCFVYIIYIAACISPPPHLMLFVQAACCCCFFQSSKSITWEHLNSHTATHMANHLQFQYHTFSQWTSCEPHLLGVSEMTHSLVSLCKLQALSNRVSFFIMTHICWITLRRFTTMLCMRIFTQPMHTDTHFIRHSLYFEASNDILLLFMCQIDPTITKIKAHDNSNAQNGIIMKLWHDKIH